MLSISLDHSVITVTDWQRSNRFYSEVLGARVVPVGAGFSYRFGNAQINCHGPGVDGTPVAKHPVIAGGSDLCFQWPGSIEGAIAHLRKHDVAVELGPVPRFGAHGPGSSVYFRDPDGSLMEFISYPDQG